MVNHIKNIKETVLTPDIIVQSKTDQEAELFYKYYEKTPVTSKYLCVIIKNLEQDFFIITSYFIDTIKKGKILWEKR